MIIDTHYVPGLGRLKIVETYAYYDEPVLYCCQNAADHLYLAVAAAGNEQHEIWLYAGVSNMRLKLIRSGAIDLHDAFADPEDGFLTQVTVSYNDNAPIQTQPVDPNRISKDMLPVPDERLDLKSDIFPELSIKEIEEFSRILQKKTEKYQRYLEPLDTPFLKTPKEIVFAEVGKSSVPLGEVANARLESNLRRNW